MRPRFVENGRICLKNRVVYGRMAAVYKVYSGGIQLVFCLNTDVKWLLLLTARRAVGLTHRAVPTADCAVMNVGLM